MIRINLAPAKRKRPAPGKGPARAPAARGSAASAGNGPLSFALMLGGWVLLLGAGWYLLTLEDDAASAVRAQAAAVNNQVKEIEAKVDQAGLQAREADIERQKIAIEKLKAKQRTPVFIMYELAMILTDAQQGGAVMIDQEKYKKNRADDPQNEINDRWDPTGLWLTSVEETGNRLTIEGAARDAADLSEFTRRLRASVWFGEITRPDYERVAETKRSDAPEEHRHLTWKLDVAVRRWN